MKIRLIALLLFTFCLCGCRREAATQVFSIAAFKPKELGRTPSAAELVVLKAFALSIYNPSSAPVAVHDHELSKLGFNPLLLVNREIPAKEPLVHVCDQGLVWGDGPKRLAVILRSVQGGVDVHADSGPGGAALTPSRENLVGSGSMGTHTFEDGLVIAWVVKPIEN